MLFIYRSLLVLVFLWPLAQRGWAANPPGKPEPPHVQQHGDHTHGLGDLRITVNMGQWPDAVKYKMRLGGGQVLFGATQVAYVLLDPTGVKQVHDARWKDHKIKGHAYTTEWLGGALQPALVPEHEMSIRENYFLGNDPSRWAQAVPSFTTVTYQEVYPGVDVRYLTAGDNLKYEVHLAPGADPTQLRLRYNGVDNIKVDEKGNLLVMTSLGPVIEAAPVAFSLRGDEVIPVPCRYVVNGDVVSYVFPDCYDTSLPLVIDPVLVFSTFSGSRSDNWGFTSTYDQFGNYYAGGIINELQSFGSPGLIATPGAFQALWNGGIDNFGLSYQGPFYASDNIFIRYNTNGTSALYITYMGGTNNEQPHSLVVTQNQELVILATTRSSNFPVTASAYDTSYNGSVDMVISKLDSNGSVLVGSTYLGGFDNDGVNLTTGAPHNPIFLFYGDDARGEVIVDSSGKIYIASATRSANFPVTTNAIQNGLSGLQDAVLCTFSPLLDTLSWSTYYGGSGIDAAFSVNVHPSGDILVAGNTNSNNLLTTLGTLHPTYQGGRADGYLLRINADSAQLVASTYIGTAGLDATYFVQVDDEGNIYTTGVTDGNYPVSTGVYANPQGGQYITKLDDSLRTAIFNTRFGANTGQPQITISAFLVDKCQNIYVSGWGGLNSGFPPEFIIGNTFGMVTTSDAVRATTDGSDFYVFALTKNAATLFYASFFGINGGSDHVDGGTSRFDGNGVVYQNICGACGAAQDPTAVTANAYSTLNRSPNCNMLSFKLDFQLVNATVATFTPDRVLGCAPLDVTFTNTSRNAATYEWDFNDGSPMVTTTSPTHTFTQTGTFNVRLIATNPNSCNIHDTTFRIVNVLSDTNANFNKQVNPCSYNVSFTADPALDYNWDFGFAGSPNPNSRTPQVVFPDSGLYTVRLISNGSTVCSDTAIRTVYVRPVAEAAFSTGNTVCTPSVQFTNNSQDGVTFDWDFGDGTTSTLRNPPNKAYAQSGSYIVRLTVNADSLCSDVFVDTIDVFLPTIAAFVAPAVICDSTVTLTNTSVNGTSFEWQLPGGVIQTTQDLTYTFPGPGTYDIRLVTNPGQPCSDATEYTLRIPEVAVSAFAWEPTERCSRVFNFTYTGTLGTTFVWDFGDGDTVRTSSPTISHTYPRSDSFTVTLLVNPDSLCTSTSVQRVFAGDNVTANFAVAAIACDSLIVPNNQSRNAQSYFWELVGVGTSIEANPVFIAPDTGTYTLRLTVEPGTLCEKTVQRQVVVSRPVPPSFVIEPQPCTGLLNLTSTVPDTAVRILWLLPDGRRSENRQEVYQGNFSGVVYFRLVTFDSRGCADTATAQYNYDASGYGTLFVPNVFTPNEDGVNDIWEIKGLTSLCVTNVSVFDRWGVLIYQTNNPSALWDGSFNSKEAPEGAYVYLIEFNNGDSRVGTVSLIR